MNDWFTIERIDKSTYSISEYKHWEETHCYLLIGKEKEWLSNEFPIPLQVVKANLIKKAALLLKILKLMSIRFFKVKQI